MALAQRRRRQSAGVRMKAWLTRWRTRDLDRDLREEMQFHMEMRAAEYQEKGMRPGDATAEAHKLFGSTSIIHEDARRMHLGAARSAIETAGKGPALRSAQPPPGSGVHRNGGARADPGDRRRHRRLQRGGSHSLPAPAVCRRRPPGLRGRADALGRSRLDVRLRLFRNGRKSGPRWRGSPARVTRSIAISRRAIPSG